MSFRYKHGDRPLEGYTVQRGVGRGGFGEVYYALSDGGREVALKTILQNHEVELRGVAHCINLKSPHLVSIFDVRIAADGTPCVIMEYVAGPSLRDLLHEHPEGLGAQRAGYLLKEIAKGLAYLHERGIVHRDLKPENIFYEDGYVKIGDYGLSKYISVSRQSGQTISVGTVHYMAPEIGSGIYNRGIDIYALGVILYELITGRVPFSGNSFGEILMKHLTAEPDVAALAEPFRSAVKRALAKKPEERFPDVESLARAVFSDAELDRSVSLFDPASFSAAARRLALPAAAPAADSPAGETAPIPRPAAPPAAPAVAPAAQRPAAAPPRALAGEPAADAAALDPLDPNQRLARAIFAVFASASILMLFRGDFSTWIGRLLVIGSGAGAVLGIELSIASRLQIAPGFWRRAVAALLAALPVSAGVLIIGGGRHPSPALALPVLLGLVFIDWRARMDPERVARISWGDAFLAALPGLVLGAIFRRPETLFELAAISLAVNAYAPFVPQELRGRLGRRGTRKGKKPASAENAAPAPAPQPALAAASELPPEAPRSPPEGAGAEPQIPPWAGLTRFFWLFAAAGLLSAGLSLLVASVFVRTRGEERLALICLGLGCSVYSLFALRQGRWERQRQLWSHFWSRSVRPFLSYTAFAGVLIGAALLGLGPALGAWPFGREETLAAVIVISSSLLLLGFAWAADRLLRPRGEGISIDWRSLPWRERPVHALVRLLQLLLAAAGLATTAGLGISGVIGSRLPETERLGLVVGAVWTGALAFYFLRQGLRRSRGALWDGTLRPLVLHLSAATIAMSALIIAWDPWKRSGGRGLHDDEVLGFTIAAIIAGVFGAFAFFLRGRQQGGRALDGFPPAAAEGRPSGWAGLGMLLWVLAVPLLLACAALVLFEEPLPGWPLRPQEVRGALVTLGAGALALAAAATLCLLAARRGAGAAHLVRALFGQAALWGAIILALSMLSGQLRISPAFEVERRAPQAALVLSYGAVVALGGVGALLLAWKPRSIRRRSTVALAVAGALGVAVVLAGLTP
jgi:hypothetical protein